MSLTESVSNDVQLRLFYEQRLTPIAQSLRARGIRFFDRQPDASRDSWYEAYPEETAELVSLEDISGELQRMWEAQGLTQLAGLVPDLLALSKQLDQSHTAEEADLSPFLYVMF